MKNCWKISESTRRLRHDWRHHLMSLNGFSENGDMEQLQSYLQKADTGI